TFDITSFTVQGLDTVSFTHANSDCPYTDQVRNLVVSTQVGTVYNNATAEGINTATNCTNTLSYTFNIRVPPPPPLVAGFYFSPASPAPGHAVSFAATASGGASPDFFTWSFGDGSNSTGASTSHTYSTTGNFT